MTSDDTPIAAWNRESIEQHQAVRLGSLLREVSSRNPFWRRKLAPLNLSGQEIRSVEDLRRLPFLTKEEILADQQANAPYGTNLTYEIGEYSRLHQTSGTTGNPMRWLDTTASWEWVLDCWRQLFQLMGLRRDDRLFFAFSFGPFLGFWAGFEGANRLGNLCLAAGGLSSTARLKMLLENAATVLCCTPTYALRLAEVAAEQNVDIRHSPVRAVLVAGEPGGNISATRQRIEEAWGARVIDHWGMTELGPMAIESFDRPGGMFVLESECIAEIIDPATGEPVPAGDEGELVITNLGRTGSPLIRYRTGDRVRSLKSASSLLFLDGGILGRTDDMITIRGNNLYPSALEDVVRTFPAVAEFRIELRTVKAMQQLKILIEPVPTLGAAEIARLAAQISDEVKSRWSFQVEIVTVAPGALPRFEMKGKRFVRVSDV
jgi:phenylacetate-CoA ligase